VDIHVVQQEESDNCDKPTTSNDVSLNEEDRRQQLHFIMASRDLREKVRKVEILQTNVLVTLLNATDIMDEVFII